MSLNTIYDYKIWDSMLGIESMTWEFSTDIDFNDIVLSKTVSGNDLKPILPLIESHRVELYCRVKITGYNGESDWFIVKEDKSDNIYVTKGVSTYSEDDGYNKNIIKEMIFDKDGIKIYDLDFKDDDEVVYLKEYDKTLDLDFLDTLNFNINWFYEPIVNSDNGLYIEDVYVSGNDYLELPIRMNIGDKKITSNIFYKGDLLPMEYNYIEIKANFMKLENSFKYIYFNDVDDITVFSITNKNDTLIITINDTEFTLPINIEDVDYLIGVSGDGKIYLNHKVEIYTGLNIPSISTIHIGNTYENNIEEIGEFKIDYIRHYTDTLPDTVSAY